MSPRAEHSSPRGRLGNPFAHRGLPLDAEIGSYQNRARQYNARLKRFMQRDPPASLRVAGSGYHDGMCTCLYTKGRPIASADPSGMGTAVVYYCQEYPSGPDDTGCLCTGNATSAHTNPFWRNRCTTTWSVRVTTGGCSAAEIEAARIAAKIGNCSCWWDCKRQFIPCANRAILGS